MVAAPNDFWSYPDPTPEWLRQDWFEHVPEPPELPPISFRIEDGDDADSAARPLVASLRGVVKHIEEDRLDVGIPGFRTAAGSLHYHLPASIDLRPLVGRKLGIDIVRWCRFPSRRGQTLFVEGSDGRLWLVAHHGSSHLWHNVDGEDLSAGLSPEPGGPLIVGPPGRERRVPAGDGAAITCGGRQLVVEFVSRDDSGTGAYVIADAALWH